MENTVQFTLTNDAVVPTRAHSDDIGYDLTAISVCKKLSENIVMYDTGVSVCPPNGYYTEVLPRSSLSKTGYMLANSVGIIDPSYRGTLKIVLIKVDPSQPDLTLPFTKMQLVLRQAFPFVMEEVKMLNETVRGSGGFGSTDKK